MDKRIIIQPTTSQDFDFLLALLKKLGFDHRIVSDSEMEDQVLLNSMIEEEKGDYVSEEEIQQVLKKK